MAVATELYGPPLSGSASITPPATIDGTGLTTTIPITIKNAKSESGVELWYTGTVATGYDLMNASGTIKGGLAIAAAANDWITTSAADEVVVHVGAGKRILFGQKGAALPTLSITPSNLVTIHGAGAFLAFTGGGGGPGVGTTDGRTFALYSNNAAVAACSSDGVNFLINSGKKLQIDSTVSATSCALQISGDVNTGIGQSSDGADSLSIYTGGAEIMRFNTAAASTGITPFGSMAMQPNKVFRIDSATSLTLCALQINGDPNTGVAAVGGADTLSVVCGGTETARYGNATFGVFTKIAAPAAQQTSGANVTNSVTSGGTDDTIANYTDLTIYANDSAAIRNDIYQLARKVKQINDGLRTLGWFT